MRSYEGDVSNRSFKSMMRGLVHVGIPQGRVAIKMWFGMAKQDCGVGGKNVHSAA